MHPNTIKRTKTWVYGPMGGSGLFTTKNSDATSCMNFCINCSSSACFAPSFMQYRNNPKCTQTVQNTLIHAFIVQWGGSGVFIVKNWCDFMAQTCALIAPVQPILHRASCSNETLPSAPKHYKTHQNMSLGSNWVDRVRSLRKIPMWLHATNLCINSTISDHFASSFVH